MSVDAEPGDWDQIEEAETEQMLYDPLGAGRVRERELQTAAGLLSVPSNPWREQPSSGLSTAYQYQPVQHSRPEERVVADNTVIWENEAQQIGASTHEAITSAHQKELDRLTQGFNEQIAELHRQMATFQQTTKLTVQNLKANLELAQKTATDAQGDNLEMAAELHKLRGRQTNDDDTTGNAMPNPNTGAAAERIALETLQDTNQRLQQEVDALRKNPSARHISEQEMVNDAGTSGHVNDDEDMEHNEHDSVQRGKQKSGSPRKRGSQADGDADDESDGDNGEGDDAEMFERPRGSRSNAGTYNLTRRRSMDYIDEDLDIHPGSDVSMEGGGNPSNRSPLKGPTESRNRMASRNLHNSQIPLPQRFSRPRSGGAPGPGIRAAPANATQTSLPPRTRVLSKRGPGSERDFKRKVDQAREWHRKKGTGENLGTDDVEVHASGRGQRPSKRLRVYSVVNLRGTNVEQNQHLKNVELLMNKLMGMTHYNDIVNVALATDLEADECAAGSENPPVLEPLRPYFGRGFKKHPWNRHLEELFIRHYEDKFDVKLDEGDGDMIADMFTDRLERLRRRYKELTKDIPDDEREAREEENRTRGRRNTRRVNDFDVRREICLESIQDQDGEEEEIWQILLEMVLLLGAYGMSSDESEVDEKGYTRYNIRKRLWRSKEVSDRLDFIDRARNIMNGKGKRLAGNSARTRIRSSRNPASERDPSIECPKNFYDAGFLKTLKNLQYRALNMKPHMDLGELQL